MIIVISSRDDSGANSATVQLNQMRQQVEEKDREMSRLKSENRVLSQELSESKTVCFQKVLFLHTMLSAFYLLFF